MWGVVATATAKPVDATPTTASAVAGSANTVGPSEGVARPERRLLVAAQYATRQSFEDPTSEVNELTIPHGLTDVGDRAGMLAVVGGLLPSGSAPTVVTMVLALEYEPMQWFLSPYLDVGAGGYLVLGRGQGRTEAPRIEWLWASTANLGVKVHPSRFTSVPLSVRAFGQAFWVEQPFVPLTTVFSGWGFGLGLEYRFGVPDVHLIRQFSHGDGMADGW